MTGLLELKQKIKTFYGEHDTLLNPLLKFLLAFLVFRGINAEMGFMAKPDNVFVVLILSIICAVLPVNAMAVIGCFMIIGHCYAVGVEVAVFAVLLVLLLLLLFLRFTSQDNLALVLTPTAFQMHMPAPVPIAGGLLRGPACAVSSACGVILHFFMKAVSEKSTVLQGKETELVQKLKILLDALLKNQEMWLNVFAFIVVLMAVHLITRASFDYSWRVADAAGAVIYIVIMVLGGMFLSININMGSVVLAAALSALIGLVIEFAVLGVDYSRSEHTQFEDDEYVYYVKAIPKSYVAQREKSIKKISSGSNTKETKRQNTDVASSQEDFDFEKRLEESLKDL